MLAAGRSFVRRLERLPTGDLVSNRDQYLELLALKRRLDDLIAVHAARGGELEEKRIRIAAGLAGAGGNTWVRSEA